MTQEEKRIKLAEANGYERLRGSPWKDTNTLAWMPLGWSVNRFMAHGEPAVYTDELPDYFNDLNAVHELEEELDDPQKMLYVAKLSQILSPSKFPQSFRILHATAEQRCEALGLTLNLW